MKAYVDSSLCTGCGLCTDACPDVFEIGDDNIARVKVIEVPPELEDACREAQNDCPPEAIRCDEK
ncbi:MAG: ferredoxin [Phycisphaerae bacterium]